MARQLRIEYPGAWYHVTSRGNERKSIFKDDRDREHFLEVIEECVHRHKILPHCYALMDNHYHLILETPQANLSRAMQWVGLSYSTWFNRRHRRVGHLFQGRFTGILLEPSRALSLSRYVHLNPVAIKRFRFDKSARKSSRAGMAEDPGKELIRARLEYLRDYRWSSYRAFVGKAATPSWLDTKAILQMTGAKTQADCRRTYRHMVEQEVRAGMETNPWEELAAQVLLGSEKFVENMKELLQGDEREQGELRALKEPLAWEDIVGAVEKIKGEKWEEFRDRYGDWGRDLVLLLGRREGGLTLKDLGRKAGGMDYGTVANALYRFTHRLNQTPALKKAYQKAQTLIAHF